MFCSFLLVQLLISITPSSIKILFFIIKYLILVAKVVQNQSLSMSDFTTYITKLTTYLQIEHKKH